MRSLAVLLVVTPEIWTPYEMAPTSGASRTGRSMETAESHRHISTLFNVFLSERAINLRRHSIGLQSSNEDKRSLYVMLLSLARDRRMVWGMGDLVVMPTLTHVDSVTLNVIRTGGMTSRMSSYYKFTTAVVDSMLQTGKRTVCDRRLTCLKYCYLNYKLKKQKVICSVNNIVISTQPPCRALGMTVPCGLYLTDSSDFQYCEYWRTFFCYLKSWGVTAAAAGRGGGCRPGRRSPRGGKIFILNYKNCFLCAQQILRYCAKLKDTRKIIVSLL